MGKLPEMVSPNDFFYEIGAGLNGMWDGLLHSIFRERPGSEIYGDQQFQLGTKSPIWIDHSNLWLVYTDIPHLNNIINKRAEYLTMGKLKLYEIDTGKEVKKHDFLTLMRRPNPLQNTAEFLRQYSVYEDIYANTLTYKLKGLSYKKVPKVIWNLPPNTMKINPTGKIYDQTELSGIIKNYEMTFAGMQRIFAPEEILFKNDNLGSTQLKSQSKILSHVKPLSNIYGALVTANVLIHDKGAYGILSISGQRDQSGIMPLGDEERERIEKQYLQDYGPHRGKRSTIVTNASLAYAPMTFPLRDMMLQEEVEQDFGILCDAFGTDRDVFASQKGATYENKKNGQLWTIQNTIMPKADNICQSFDEDFGLTEEGLCSKIVFSHLPIMKEDEQKASTALNQRASAAGTLVDRGVFKPEEVRKLFPQLDQPATNQ